jgi:hypothetical protein
MKYDVYFNLTKKLYSLRPCEGEHKGRVVAHCETVSMSDVVFRVSEAARKRVLRDKQKNVHAVARGTVISCQGKDFEIDPDKTICPTKAKEIGKRFTYCPYRSGSFQAYSQTGDLFDIQKADHVLLDTKGNRFVVGED